LIEIFEELDEILLNSFTLGSDKSFQFLVNAWKRDEKTIDFESQGIYCLMLLLLHANIVDLMIFDISIGG
jgi:hypothetical protein